MGSQYHAVYDSWRKDPDAFWAEAAKAIDWDRRWDKVFDQLRVGQKKLRQAGAASRMSSVSSNHSSPMDVSSG